jgi:DNA-binding GntR family transcriptional regulator
MARASFIKPVRSDSLAKQISDTLKDAIFAGKFLPGEPLRELHLARMFEVSQATVREALVQLEQSGLVVREQNRKTTVTSFSAAEIGDRLSVRLILEQLAFVRAAEHMDESDFKKLDGLAQAIQKAVERGSWKDVTVNDLRFHQFVWEKAHSPVLYHTLEQLTTPLFAFLGATHEADQHEVRVGQAHEALTEALRSNDQEKIQTAVRSHLDGYVSIPMHTAKADPESGPHRA